MMPDSSVSFSFGISPTPSRRRAAHPGRLGLPARAGSSLGLDHARLTASGQGHLGLGLARIRLRVLRAVGELDDELLPVLSRRTSTPTSHQASPLSKAYNSRTRSVRASSGPA